ncbi:Uncharacterized membrane protein [Kytococcus aerolatus]|uniref:Uncharacterized membrane protein n=1 Tax=Kytococcus aerolatus TaxID=592308 RepID=A0A212T0Q3_9MICO|nr:hypothetical protein [Kytococcus aerolatus]SNC59618.1 Uncharacterized membrane protein [Kytococcus aerolatus]
MAPLIALLLGTGAAAVAAALGVELLEPWTARLAIGLAVMLLLTGSAHFVPRPRRRGLIAMVPPWVPAPHLVVTATGLLELAAAAGLVTTVGEPVVRSWIAAGVAVFLVAVFPANLHAARGHAGPEAPATPLLRRSVLQAVYLVAALVVAVDGL